MPTPILSIVDGDEAGPSDDALMLRAAAGDARAFEDLVARYEPSMRRFCRVMLRDEQWARDTAQDVFLRLWEWRERYDAQGRFKAFAFTVARNLCRTRQRRRAVLSFVGLDGAPEPEATGGASGFEALAQSEDAALVAAALDRLPESFRVPLLLRYAEDMPYAQIAEVIGRTESAARSRVHYGLKALAALLPDEVMR